MVVDLYESENIEIEYLAEVIYFRSFDCEGWVGQYVDVNNNFSIV